MLDVIGNIAGGIMDWHASRKANKRNIAFQREFAQSGLQWKMEDAKKAGIHPLAAIGAPTSSPTTAIQPESMGKSLSRAGEKLVQHKANELALEEARIRNKKIQKEMDYIDEQIKSSQHARQNQGGAGYTANDQTAPGNVAFPGTSEEYVGPQATAQDREDLQGEVLGEIGNIKKAFGKGLRHARDFPEDRKRAGYVMDKRTGRVIRNPNYTRYKKTRRGRRRY